MEILCNEYWLPIIFTFLMGLSVLIYVILDGYDLGVGMAMKFANEEQRNVMLSSIAPFWDANETWLVLGIGILLVAFPTAHGIILTSLYLPTVFMLIGIILRGASFDFIAKAHADHKSMWSNYFIIGSALASFSQGYMLGSYINGFKNEIHYLLFNLLVGICLSSGYLFVGSGWLIMKTSGELQKKAISWARASLWLTACGICVVSIVTPLLSERIFEKWFSLPNFFFLLPIPVITCCIVIFIMVILKKLPLDNDRLCWVPFVSSMFLFFLGFIGLAYSFFPYIVPEKMTIFEAASSADSLLVILAGVIIVLPLIIIYTIISYKIFWGKAEI